MALDMHGVLSPFHFVCNSLSAFFILSCLNVHLLTGSVNIVIFEANYLYLIKLGGIKCSTEVALCPPIAVSFFNLFNITEVYIAQDTYI